MVPFLSVIREARLHKSLHDEALARVRERVLSFLAEIPERPIPPEVRELRRRLEALLQDPSTISDTYWSCSPDYVL